MFKKIAANTKEFVADITQTFKFSKFDGVIYLLAFIVSIALILGVAYLAGAAGIFILNTLFGFTLAYSLKNIAAVLIARWFVKSLSSGTFSIKFN